MEDKRLILNRIQTPDGTILTSYHVHDYKTHIDATNGQEYMVDGGLSYIRRSANGDEIALDLYADEPFEIIRKNLHWGVNYTKDMVSLPQTKWTPICEMNIDHLQAILDRGYGSHWIREFMNQELKYRECST
jgi:hypothetical protein